MLALVFAGVMSSVAAVALVLLLVKLSSGSPVCEGPTFGAARLWQFDVEKLALLGIAATLAAGLCALFAMVETARAPVRRLLRAFVFALASALAFFLSVAALAWTPCLNT